MLLLLLAAKYEALNSRELNPIGLKHVKAALDGIYIADEDKRKIIYKVFNYNENRAYEEKYYYKKLRQVRKTMMVEYDDELEACIIKLKGLGIYPHNIEVAQIYIAPYCVQDALDELGIDAELIIELVRDFVQELESLKEEYFACAHQALFDKNYLWAHRFKGVSANLRIQRIYKIFDYIENSKNKIQIEDMLEELYHYLPRLLSDLKKIEKKAL